jgi:predicted flap endonuclease-1-like 5' DNA nuclease
MLSQMGTIEVSRTTKDVESVAAAAAAIIEEAPIEIVAEPIVETISEVEVVPLLAVKKFPDDLTLIEGIGPKIAELLVKNEIDSFRVLAISEITHLRVILDNAGSRFQMHKPDTWPEQARLAAEGDWEAFEALKLELNAGKAK